MAIVIALALSLAGAGAAQAASDAASERQVRANLAANPGSERVGPGRIRLEPGLTMTLPDRGSARAAKRRALKCNEGYFCIYELINHRGASLGMSACRTYILQNYAFIDIYGRRDRWRMEASSWRSRQTGGAVATLWSEIGTWFKAPRGGDDNMGTWDNRVISVKPC
ncbi:MAG TPA: hypothetical protein VNO82_17980 [Solirubrobacteraceae bacterium]|nr:hypothetical protein [Solirubrobacteraceae bacterium]